MSKEQTSEEELDNDSSEKIIENEKIDEEDKIPLSEHEKIKDEYLRLAADFENYKKRSEKEKESI
jgi:molecular chaperone GrpE